MKKQTPQGSIFAPPDGPASGAAEGYGVKPIRAGQEPLGHQPLGRRKASSSGSITAKQRRGAQAARTRGRLDREVLAKLGRALKDCFDEVRTQEVPERFRTLLQQF
jgi:hypothetical protein